MEIDFYLETLQKQCKLAEEDFLRKLNLTANLKQYFRQPKCANILETLTKGQ